MRLVTWVVLVGLSMASVGSGRLQVALVLAGLKALAVGLEFMELREAARLHALGFATFVALLVLVLSVLR
ncbi:MAG: hypothetical protein Q8S33_09000 [Myxococcales bacterium]|nr:hypothetical protein [Myxococcales bacterium]